ncbi:MAG: YeeE/YedE family protein [Phycisphaeraceae bacterium]|nr:YeeE/YedE family protein [Phycisphaerales bacterium]MCB9860435.1 YeeE/YedE family protein [Phycisphaeraceae bacterium]
MPNVTLASAWFDSPSNLLLGVLTGLVFGFLLQKGGVTRFDVIVNQFRFKDNTVLKTMLTAIIVGGVGLYAMKAFGMDIKSHVKTAALVAVGGGGLIFGIGMALLGYCPGTAVAAIGEGSRHAIFGVVGMVVGAAVYAEIYPWLNKNVLKVQDLGKVTIPEQLHLSPWIMLIALIAGAGALFFAMERMDKHAPDA